MTIKFYVQSYPIYGTDIITINELGKVPYN